MKDEDRRQEYITVGELSVGFSENVLQPAGGLAGKEIELYHEQGMKSRIAFLDAEVLKWETQQTGRTEKLVCSYRAIMPREHVYFVDFIASYGDTKSVSIILDVQRSFATVITGILPSGEDMRVPLIVRAEKAMPLSAVQVNFEHASLDSPFNQATLCHEKTRDLIGKRAQWVYSSKDAYEHIYLNENTYTWHCIAGN